MKAKVRGWHYGAHKKTIINIDGPRYWENTGGRPDMFESVQISWSFMGSLCC